MILRAFSVLLVLAGACLGQSAPVEPRDNSLCLLQKSIRRGEHETVRVSGIFSEGLDLGIMDDAACPDESTWVELSLKSDRNKEKLRRRLGRSRRAYVLFEGEFYGPPPPDPKLPEKFRENYRPNWGYANCCRTKLVVHAIHRVDAAPAPAERPHENAPLENRPLSHP
jgi:hypothetical protein